MISSARKGTVFDCALALALAAFARLPSLFHDGLWRDQANVFVQELAPTFSEFFHRLVATEYHPPLYFLLAAAFTATFGRSEFAFLFLPYLFSVATVVVVYGLGVSLGSRRVGFIAASFFAISPAAVEDSTNYLYPIMGFVSTLLVYLVFRYRHESIDRRRWITIAVSAMLVTYTHYAALLFVPIVAFFSTVVRPSLRERVVVASAVLTGLLFFVLWSPIFMAQRSVGMPYSLPLSLVDRSIFGLGNLIQSMPTGFPTLAIAILAISLVRAYVLVRSGKLDAGAAAIAAIYMATIASASVAGLISLRYVTPFCGLLYVFLAYLIDDGVDELARYKQAIRFVPYVGAALAALFVLPSIAHVYAANRSPRSGISTLQASHKIDRDALYVIAPDYLVATFAFYTRQSDIAHVGFAQAQHSDVFVLDGYEKVWNSSDVVDRSIAEIARLAASHGRIHFIVDRRASDQGRIRYGKVWRLLERLRIAYALENVSEYRGRQEDIEDYRFRKRPVTASSGRKPT